MGLCTRCASGTPQCHLHASCLPQRKEAEVARLHSEAAETSRGAARAAAEAAELERTVAALRAEETGLR